MIAEQRDFRISFPIYDVPEYRNFLSTVIVVPRTFLRETSFRESCALLLTGLQEALHHLEIAQSRNMRDVLKLVNQEGRFTAERVIDAARVSGNHVVPIDAYEATHRNADFSGLPLAAVDERGAQKVYDALIRGNIYSSSGAITQRQWESTWRSRSLEPPPLSEYFDASIVDEVGKARRLPTRLLGKALHHRITRRSASGVGLLVGYATLVTLLASFIAGGILLIDGEAPSPDSVAWMGQNGADVWLSLVHRVEKEFHLLYIILLIILASCWWMAGLTRFGRKYRHLLRVFSSHGGG